jgi:NADPH-dependent curcumin reductase CurA
VNAPARATEIRLASRPQGWPTLADFSIVDTDIPASVDGQLLVRNLVLSVDPYMRGRMSDAKSYGPPYELGKAMDGGAIGEVVESRADAFKPGDRVLHQAGWRTHAVIDAGLAIKIDPEVAPLTTYLGVLGLTGLTAYIGLFDVAEFKDGDTVYVSGAAELGFDAAFNYKDRPVVEQLRAAAPEGIDVYFDNVGGEHLEAAIDSINVHGHMAICGMISQYNATEPNAAPRNLHAIIAKRFTMRGLLAIDYFDRQADFVAEVAPLVASGKLKYAETVVEGIRNAPQAFLDMLGGANTGKMLVRVAD